MVDYRKKVRVVPAVTHWHPRKPARAFRCYPRDCYYEGSIDNINFEAQSHGFCTRCLRFVPTLLTTTQDSLTGWGVNLYRWDSDPLGVNEES